MTEPGDGAGEDAQTLAREALESFLANASSEAQRYLAVPHPPELQVARSVEFSLWDHFDNRYFDLTGVAPVGHLNPAVTAAVVESLQVTDRLGGYDRFLTSWHIDFAKMVSIRVSPDHQKRSHQVAYAISADEAMRLALQLARRPGREAVAVVSGGIVPGHRVLEPGQHTTSATWEGVAAFVVEVVQAEHGCRPVPPDWLRATVLEAQENGVAVIADERWTGMGRLGLVAGQHTVEVYADMTVFGHTAGAGFPSGLLIADPSWFVPGTWSVNPVAGHPAVVVAGMAVMAHLGAPLLEHVRDMGDRVMPELVQGLCSSFSDIFIDGRGAGLLWGIRMPAAVITDFCRLCTRMGVLVGRSGDWLRLAPPLLASEDYVRSALDAVADAAMDSGAADFNARA